MVKKQFSLNDVQFDDYLNFFLLISSTFNLIRHQITKCDARKLLVEFLLQRTWDMICLYLLGYDMTIAHLWARCHYDICLFSKITCFYFFFNGTRARIRDSRDIHCPMERHNGHLKSSSVRIA